MLSLPQKTSFQLYKKSLGKAMKNKSYLTINNLSNVGIRVGEEWSNDDFVCQCNKLMSNAVWWERLDQLEIDFEPKFLSSEGNKNKYVASERKRASRSNTRRGNPTANSNCTFCDRLASRRVVTHCLC